MFHVNPLPTEDSLETSSLIFSEKQGKYLSISAAAVVIGTLRVTIRTANSLLQLY